MKVLQVLVGGAWGGGSVVVLAITRALIARGDRVWVACLDDENARKFREAGATVVRPPLWFRPINPLDIGPLLYLAGLCWKERFDLVATHTSKGGFLGRIAARAAATPHIVHYAHGFSFNKALNPAVHRFYVLLERLAARAGDLTISVNEEQRRMAVKLGVDSPERICTVHNGIDLSPYAATDRETARQRLGLDAAVPVVGTVGRLVPQKGFAHLIRAFPLLAGSLPSVRLVIAGEGPLEAELRREADQTGLADRIDFLGFRRNIPEILAAFDVFALPSLWEGLSISLLEALAAGKPIVATDIDGNREAIEPGETGLLVPAADPAALAEALRSVLLDSLLAQTLARNARRCAAIRFSQDRMVEENLAVYDRVVHGGRSGPHRRDVTERLAPMREA